MTTLSFPTNRQFDLACLGRLAVDFYGETVGVGIENTHHFQKYLGGSSANIAAGTARLGLKSAMISRVGNEQLGQFLRNTLAQEGCDTSQISTDPNRLTGLVFLSLKDQDTFPLLFYRRDCADMALSEADIDPEFIANCRALLITGTHLSTPTVLAASRKALLAAREAGTRTVLDIDYRPVLWGLTSTGDGETRYIASESVSAHLQAQLPLFDLIIGTEEEFLIAGGVENDLLASLNKVREVSDGVLVLKRGALGCQIFTGAIPEDLDQYPIYGGERIEVLNVLGAGDAFASGLLYGLLRGKTAEESARIANVCGAIVVSRHACSPAMPTPDELEYWLNKGGSRPDLDKQLQHLHRVSRKRPDWSELYVLAFDHRAQFEQLVLENGASIAQIPALKSIIFKALEKFEQQEPALKGKLGILADGTYAKQVLSDATERSPAWWIGRPVELPSSRPLQFDQTRSLASILPTIPREQTIKCLVFMHPEDAPHLRIAQEQQLLSLWEAVNHSQHELLLEIIPPAQLPASAKESDNDAIVLRTVARLYHLGIKPDWWKLGGMRKESWEKLSDLIAQHDPYCRGAVLLGLNQNEETLLKQFEQANHEIVKGFMIGRSVWAEPLTDYLQQRANAEQTQQLLIERFARLVRGWQQLKETV